MTSPPPRSYEVSCVLPVYNEAECILGVLEDLLAALRAHTRDFEIVVVDDGSVDGSGSLLDRAAEAEPRLRVIHFGDNRGYGVALRRGFAQATMPLVFFMDSDGQFDPMDLGRALSETLTADIVVGYRRGRRDGALRAGLSLGFNAAVRALLPVRVRDVNCAFKVIRRSMLEAAALSASGYCLNAELLAEAAMLGYRVTEIGVEHRARRGGASKVSVMDVPRAFFELVAVARRVRAAHGSGKLRPIA